MNLSPRALLFTDVVDSTKLSHALGDADMASLWSAHDRAARDLLRDHRGREIEKTDGLLALFDSVADAAAFALAYHRALAALPVPLMARAAVHLGPLGLRESGEADIAQGAKRVEVDGLVKPVTARVMALALGGQTLLTAEARAALGPTTLRLLSHGHWRLKGLPEPVELFEVGEPDDTRAPFTPPPDDQKAWRVVRQRDLWVPVREVRHSVPAERDSFVGREEPLHQLAAKLGGGARLVSVLGIGGTGKTRLVIRFAWTWLGDYPAGVWFCDLSQARSVDGIHFAVAQGLDVPLGKTEPVVQLAQAIAGRGKCLVILDNFEQVARHAEETLGHWLDRAPQAQFVVTTREVLGIVGEETLALAPLAADDAVALFSSRARSARHDYRPSPDDLATIAQLVKMLDGLPLAIELAAARVRVMPPRALLERMNRRFDVLMSRSGRHDRQATLRAAFDWSWELLSQTEKTTLAQLSVFEGGFTLATAEAVVDPTSGATRPAVVDLIQWLVDKSLVRQLGEQRFDLLECVREYAAEHLARGEGAQGTGHAAPHAVRRRHWNHYAGLDEAAAIADRCADVNNIVAACRAAIAAGETHAAIGCLQAAWFAIRLTGPFRVALQLATACVDLPDHRPEGLASACFVAGAASRRLGDQQAAFAHLERGLAGSRDARLLLERGSLLGDVGRLDEALESLAEALALVSPHLGAALESSVETAIGRVVECRGHIDDARQHYLRALGLARQAGSRRLEGGILGNLGGLHLARGQHDAARSHYEQALLLANDIGDRRWEGSARSNLGLLCQQLGQFEEALLQFTRALAIAKDLGDLRLEYVLLCNLGILCAQKSDHATALGHLEAATASARSARDARSEGQFSGYRAVTLAHLGRFDDARSAWDSAQALLTRAGDRMSLALLWCQGAEIEMRTGNLPEAEARLDAAAAEALALQVEPGSELAAAITSICAQIKTDPRATLSRHH